MHRVLCLSLVLLTACGTSSETAINTTTPPIVSDTIPVPLVEPAVVESTATNPTNESGLPVADVGSVAVTGEAGNYTFAVTLSSADTGCEQYADWWEVADLETGDLLYRRILAHSHVNEQPFTRSGGPVEIESNQVVIIRAHMGGLQSHYGGQVLGGSVDHGFQPVEDALASLESVDPLPKGCAF